MRVSELIQELSKYPSDTLVATSGFDECGFSDVRPTSPVNVVKSGVGFCDYFEGEGGEMAVVVDWSA